MSDTNKSVGQEVTIEKGMSKKGWLALAALALALVAIGLILGSVLFGGETVIQTIPNPSSPDKIVSGAVAMPNATTQTIESLGGPNKVKVASRKENLTTIRTVETDLIVNDENTSVNAPKTKVIAGEGVTMILGNETVETKKTRAIKLIEVQKNVSKKEAKP